MSGGIRPFFFGPAARPLFGILHAAAGGAPLGARGAAPNGRRGVLLCAPAPHEARQTHWALRALAERLAAAGLPTLRFDHGGTGDSAGDACEARLDAWVGDVAAAADELRDATGVRRVAVVGLRLGAALGLLACGRGLAPSELVLWNPVVRGRAHLRELEAAHRWQQREAYYPEDPRRGPDELLGVPTSAALRADLEALDLLARPTSVAVLGGARRVAVVGAGDRPAWHELAAHLRAGGADVTLDVVADQTLADPADWQRDVLMPHAGIAAVVGRLAGGLADVAAAGARPAA